MSMEIKDATGEPRPDDQVEAALQAVKEKIVREPTKDPMMTIHFITINDALEELLAFRRAARAEAELDRCPHAGKDWSAAVKAIAPKSAHESTDR